MSNSPTPIPVARDRTIAGAIERTFYSPTELAGWLAAVGAWIAVLAFAQPLTRQIRTGQEAFCYWIASLHAPYALSDWTQPIAYVYSPAFLQLVEPLARLPWLPFFAVWTGLLILAVRYLAGPRLFVVGLLVAAMELVGGNISLLLTVAIVIGFRWPAAWAFVLLTKVTPGIGLLWFAVRGEWRSLGIALGATLVVVVASAIVMPGAWVQWFELLVSLAGRDGTWAAVPVPLVVRLPIAVAFVVWGARTDRRWTVPVAAMLALPALWYGSMAMLLGVIALRTPAGPGEGSDGDLQPLRRAPAPVSLRA